MSNANLFHPPLPQQAGERLHWKNLYGASTGLALAQVIAERKQPFLIIAQDSLAVSHLIDELQFFGNAAETLLTFPDWETLPYDHFSPHQDIISERLSALYRIPTLGTGAIITTVSTLMHSLPPSDFLEGHSFLLKLGDLLNIDILRTRLTKAGYHAVSQVREHGEFAIRGSIIDLFPMGSRTPFRIDLFDNEVDSIRVFSPDTQRSLEKLTEIRLLPAKEFPLTENAIEHFRQAWRSQFGGNPLKSPIYQDISEGICSPGIEYYLPLFFDKTATLFDYLPDNTCVVSIGDLEAKAVEFWQEIEMRYEQGRHDTSRPLLSPKSLFVSAQSLKLSLRDYPQISINHHEIKDTYTFATEAAPSLDIDHKATQPLAALQKFAADYPGRLLFCAETAGRREVLLQLFRTISLSPTYFHSWREFLASDKTRGIVVAPLEEGFCLSDLALTLLTETQLYGKRVMQRRLRKKSVQDPDALIRDLTELQIDDPVVHIDHGVGRYRGLQTLKVGDQVAEFLCLEYQGGDKLYVPVASLHLISRYTGTDLEHTPINKLGTENWQRAKRKAAEKVRDVAAELLDLYAKRAARPGHKYTLPDEQYAAFAAAFPFEETPDQLQAIEQVFNDMTSDKPMDRVICGDVGFGKTEVALRAAFLAVQNGKQVALLVPTTLLAQQHFQNFQDRFADWPIQVEMLSRFRTGKEQKNILQRMENGKIDIIIGTHKLLQQDIKFKSLGLVIIDEEHRFGVKQKEKLKALRTTIDMLTLTATPIPRTMNMALSGIRDLSVIATPPARRLSVKTFVHEYNDAIIQEAIQREIMRGGQVYFLHNDITTINKKAEEISTLVHEARPTVAHGQMHERELERVMSEFYHRHFNVLVCSTIIESGIDVPTANTIIINRADKFGLAQLHQLRGRVGRSHHQAYAYLLIPSREHITDHAAKRLDAIAALDDLGIGFTLATHDLEIRGAGELLGEEQSGEMQEIGFTLYMDLLSRAVDALKAGKEPDFDKSLLHQGSEIDLHLTALIPENYLGDVQLRLQFYKRIATAKETAELDEIQVEMIDRFGLLPDQLKNLFALTELKLKAEKLGIIKLEAGEKGGKFEFSERPQVKPETIIRLIQTKPQQYRLDGPTRLRFTLDTHEPKERIGRVEKLLDELFD
ncbi:transcription-repair coupling factor [Aquicella lusitana]|uniref:Transcription-repair-coupling factor n=1 Tax=Aquicella lusitana TaxID=254246 RepID=A0A370GYV2_9COXI|nr:transcription-repair coupling factor [Aquicella lusitana]RDI48822.1 transcription-repair coupling factor [Aquicella lusitana]VVC73250.1 Transcription-repair-coupling factor [Aquicella lusitana]